MHTCGYIYRRAGVAGLFNHESTFATTSSIPLKMTYLKDVPIHTQDDTGTNEEEDEGTEGEGEGWVLGD